MTRHHHNDHHKFLMAMLMMMMTNDLQIVFMTFILTTFLAVNHFILIFCILLNAFESRIVLGDFGVLANFTWGLCVKRRCEHAFCSLISPLLLKASDLVLTRPLKKLKLVAEQSQSSAELISLILAFVSKMANSPH